MEEDIPTRFFRTKFGITPDGNCSDSQKKMLASYSEIQRIVNRYHDLWATQTGENFSRFHNVRTLLLLPLDAAVKIDASPKQSYMNFVSLLAAVLTGQHPEGLEAITAKGIVEMLVVPKVGKMSIRTWEEFVSGVKRGTLEYKPEDRLPTQEETLEQVKLDRQRMIDLLKNVFDVSIELLEGTGPGGSFGRFMAFPSETNIA